MKLVELLTAYPVWAKVLFAGWVVYSAALVVALVLFRPPETPSRPADPPDLPAQSATIEKSPGSTLYQAGRDIHVTQQIGEIQRVDSIVVEARLTCDLKTGAEIPPAEVPFLPVGDAHSYLEGPGGKVQVAFESPVRFRHQSNDSVVATNRFVLPAGSPLQHQPIQALKNYNVLSVPIVTVVYGQSLKTIRLLEVIFRVNGKDVWYGRWEYKVPFQVGPRFSVPLAQLHERLK